MRTFLLTGFTAAAVLLVLWITGTRRTLAALDGNIQSALEQIGVHLSSRFDALTRLNTLLRHWNSDAYAAVETEIITRRRNITAASSLQEIASQQQAAEEIFARIRAAAGQYPALAASPEYLKFRRAVENCGGMVRTSCLIYNDSVSKFNRRLGVFPFTLLFGAMGFHRQKHLDTIH